MRTLASYFTPYFTRKPMAPAATARAYQSIERLNVPGARHAYDVEVTLLVDGARARRNVEVWAANREQAAIVAEAAGYNVAHVSMI